MMAKIRRTAVGIVQQILVGCGAIAHHIGWLQHEGLGRPIVLPRL